MMNKILIVNPFGIGDVLFTTPVIANLRRACPDAAIAYLANARTAPVLRADPRIREVFVYERDAFNAAKWVDLWTRVRRSGFDTVFDFSMNEGIGFFLMSCGIPRRIGFNYRNRGRFLTDKTPLAGYEDKHVVDHYLDLLQRRGIPVVERTITFPMTDADRDWAGQWLAANGIQKGSPCIAIVPGGGASWGEAAKYKRWPAAKYADLVDKIVEKSSSEIILMGDPKEKDLCADIVRSGRPAPPVGGGRVHNAAGQTTLGQMAALLTNCRLAVVNDGGPLHIAAACGVRTVSIFGPVDPVVYGPYPADGHVVVRKGLACQPCYRGFRMASCGHISCLNDLSVEEGVGDLSV